MWKHPFEYKRERLANVFQVSSTKSQHNSLVLQFVNNDIYQESEKNGKTSNHYQTTGFHGMEQLCSYDEC